MKSTLLWGFLMCTFMLTYCVSGKCSNLNGIVEEEQECDTMGSDGCSSGCEVMQGYYCIWWSNATDDGSECWKCNSTWSPCDEEEGNLTEFINTTNHDNLTNETINSTLFCFEKCSSPATCGNALLDPSEQCDDGNLIDADGCSSTCQLEPSILCGNSILEYLYDEQCDDGNRLDADGCNSNCQIEQGYTCLPTPQGSICSMCGNAVVESDEACDDGNHLSGDGCASSCEIEHGYTCTTQSSKSICHYNIINNSPSSNNQSPLLNTLNQQEDKCGNGKLQSSQRCDDGNLADGDGCNNICNIEIGYDCTYNILGRQSRCEMIALPAICGDGVLVAPEECDDGNTRNRDGCSSACRRETGFVCEGDVCEKLCGNTVIDTDAKEHCDDGNEVSGDGCSAVCQVEVGWECRVSFFGSSICVSMCGNQQLQPQYGEQCDDGNLSPGDGCTDCVIDPQFNCSVHRGKLSVCYPTGNCGNGAYEPDMMGEQCDDGNDVDDDGCSNNCKISGNYQCTNIPGQTTTCTSMSSICRNGHIIPDTALPMDVVAALEGTSFGGDATIADLVERIVYYDGIMRIDHELQRELAHILQAIDQPLLLESVYFNQHYCVGYF